VAYKGGAPAALALVSGEIPFMFGSNRRVAGHVNAAG